VRSHDKRPCIKKLVKVKKIISFLLIINFCPFGYSQIIRGTILDKSNDSKISFASIYLSGTFDGTQSDLNGNFELDISKNASKPLTISSIGYTSVTLTVFSTDKPLIIYMTPKVYEVKEIVISSKSLVKRRMANLNLFKNVFLGTTGNARHCEIINENDITFNYDSDRDTLKAFASKPIIIYNKSLGYKITYYLDRFEYYKKDRSLFFAGNLIFNEDLAIDDTHEKLYERRRKEAYLGSRMHFFRALWADNLESSGFSVKNSTDKYLKYKDIVEDSQQDTLNKHSKFLKYNGKLSIFYNTRSSNITFLKEKVGFDKDGYYDQTNICISWEGEMMDQRVGDMLPYTYKLE
jgi:CarboxypepD_reg-like domain